ncbi:MAG: radical SAM protein, partial [Candidatus Cloacimonetes bacterium]|nr:radical SAM protein [Candidatus Cloacimonadota bacterium]
MYKLKLHIISLGCPKNLVDSERFAWLAVEADLVLTDTLEQADFILINTCGFIESAREESVETILTALELRQPNAKVWVTGCMVQRYLPDLQREIPEVEAWVNLKDFTNFAGLVKFSGKINLSRQPLQVEQFAFLRIADGCNNNCSYCAIPSIRGRLVSETEEKLVREARLLVQNGARELIITGQDITRYGLDSHGKSQLVPLLEKLHELEKLAWIRLMYLHPAHVDKAIISAVRDMPKVR